MPSGGAPLVGDGQCPQRSRKHGVCQVLRPAVKELGSQVLEAGAVWTGQ